MGNPHVVHTKLIETLALATTASLLALASNQAHADPTPPNDPPPDPASDLTDAQAEQLFNDVQDELADRLALADPADPNQITASWDFDTVPATGLTTHMLGIADQELFFEPEYAYTYDVRADVADLTADDPIVGYALAEATYAFGTLSSSDTPPAPSTFATVLFLVYEDTLTNNTAHEAIVLSLDADFILDRRRTPNLVAVTPCEAYCFGQYDGTTNAAEQARRACILTALRQYLVFTIRCTVSLVIPPPKGALALLACKVVAAGRLAYNSAVCETQYQADLNNANTVLQACLAACQQSPPHTPGTPSADPPSPTGPRPPQINP